jgi:hypothetical protein
MSLATIEQAKRNAILARQRLDTTLVAFQQRVKPGNLAGEAWQGVKGRSADLADGALVAVRKRPAAVSVAVGALALLLAREPIKRAVDRLVSDKGEPDGEASVRTKKRRSRTKAKDAPQSSEE